MTIGAGTVSLTNGKLMRSGTVRLTKATRAKMTMGAGTVSLTNGKLMVSGQGVLSNVHDNVSLTPVVSNDDVLCDGAFIGVKSDHKGSLRVFPVGKLLYVCNLLLLLLL
ncbi:hypothetical protein EUGRSUZ_L03033 [Eucalyptus grandis]|uniref:Uncharacterized protein n=1 Tax=Eucalyptus grandis TaxID=71139 RepID=A0AAD9T876_EUCGR|nr:hypothetical protein EUGRSUZ_L03033 [Eucalyptus grandis]